MPHSPAWFPRTTFLSVKRASVTERIFLQVWWQFSQSVVSPFPSFGKEGWLKAGVVGGYTMLIITDLRIHLPPPPTGTPPSRRRRMENTIDYQIIIFLIKFTTKFEEEPVFIDLTLMPSLIVYIPLFIRNVAMRVTTRSSLRVNSYLQTVFSGEFPIHLLLKAYGIKT